MHRRPLIRFTLFNAVVVTLAFIAVPLPLAFDVHPGPVTVEAASRAESPYDLAVRGLRSDDRAERVTAIRILGVLCDRRAVTHLARLESASDPEISREAVLALARLTGDASIVRRLATKALEDVSAVDAIGACEDESAEFELLALSGPRDPWVRGTAIKALARRSQPAAVALIADALRSGEEPLRLLALEAAIGAPHPALVASLRELSSSRERVERRLALAALYRAGEHDALASLEEMVGDAHRAGEPWVEVLTAEAMVLAGCPGGVRHWRAGFDAMADTDRAAVIARLRPGFPEAFRPELRELLSDRSAEVRLAAALALGAAGDASVADILRREAPGADPETAARCAVVLAGLR